MTNIEHRLIVRDAEAFSLCLALGVIHAVRNGKLPTNAGIWTLGLPVFSSEIQSLDLPENLKAIFSGADEWSMIQKRLGQEYLNEVLDESIELIESHLSRLQDASAPWWAKWEGKSEVKSAHTFAVFASAAKAYCDWAESTFFIDADGDQILAERLLCDLYRHALDLPDVSGGEEAPDIPEAEWQKVYKRFQLLKPQSYSKLFDPSAFPPENEVVACDLADDLADIWRDLKSGLILWEAGSVDAAAWEWRFSLSSHWRRHVTGALQALSSTKT